MTERERKLRMVDLSVLGLGTLLLLASGAAVVVNGQGESQMAAEAEHPTPADDGPAFSARAQSMGRALNGGRHDDDDDDDDDDHHEETLATRDERPPSSGLRRARTGSGAARSTHRRSRAS